MRPMNNTHTKRATVAGSSRPALDRSEAGFTILEVLLAVVILTIGGASVIAMQSVVASSNKQSVQRFEASAVADQALARMQLVGTQWTVSNDPTNSFNGLNLTNLSQATDLDYAEWTPYETGVNTGPNTWNRLGAVTASMEDDSLAGVASRYCVNFRLRRPTGDVATAVGGDQALGLIIADVRVYWPRVSRAEDLFVSCQSNNEDINEIAEAEMGATVGNFRGGDVVMLEKSAVILRNVWWRGANDEFGGV